MDRGLSLSELNKTKLIDFFLKPVDCCEYK